MKLTKGIEESKKEKERLVEEKEKLRDIFKEIEQKAFTIQENYKKTHEVFFFFFNYLLLIKIHKKKDFFIPLYDLISFFSLYCWLMNIKMH